MTTRPGYTNLKSKQRPSSAIYIGSDPQITLISPPNLPDLPEPPSPVASNSSRGSGLPSPPATNSTGSGSTGGDDSNNGTYSTRNQRPSSSVNMNTNMLNETNMRTFQDALANANDVEAKQYRDGNDDDDDDDEHNDDGENEEDNTARLDRLLALRSNKIGNGESPLQRVKSLTERNRMTIHKITSRLSSPSPVPSQRTRSPAYPPPPHSAHSASSSSSSSHTASTSSSRPRPRTSDSAALHNTHTPLHHSRSQSYAYDLTPEHLSGSETERESTHNSHYASSHSYSSSSSSYHSHHLDNSIASTSSSQIESSQPTISQNRPRTPPPSHRIRLTSAPASPAKVREQLSSSSNARQRTPRKRASMAMTTPYPEDEDDYTDVPFDHRESIRGLRASSRVGYIDRDNPIEDNLRDGIRAPSRTGSTYARRTARQPLPREFLDHSSDDQNEDEVRATGIGRQTSTSSSVTGDRDGSVVEGSNGSIRSGSRASGQIVGEPPPTPHRNTSHYQSSRQAQLSPQKRPSNWSNTARDLTRRHQTRWLSGEVSFSDEPINAGSNGVRLGRRQSLRGGSAESALGLTLGTGRSLVGEGLRAAGLTKRDTTMTDVSQRRLARDNREVDMDRRPSSRLSGGTGRYSDSFRPSSRAGMNGHLEFRTPDHPPVRGGDGEVSRKVATAPRANTSMATYRASIDGASSSTGRGLEDGDDDDEPKTAPLLRTYRSSLGALGGVGARERERYSSPFGSTRRRDDGVGGGATSREQQAKHAELMKHSLDVFASNVERLGLSSGEGGRELVRSAEEIVSAAERLNDLIKSNTNRALTEQIDAEVGNSGGGGDDGVDLVEVWRSVGGQWRDGLRVSDELVRSVTAFLLSVGRAVKDLGGGGGVGGDGGHGRSISLDEEVLNGRGRMNMSPEVTTASSSGVTGRRSVVGSRKSWEPAPRDREREREETLKKLAGGSDNANAQKDKERDVAILRPHSELRNARTQKENPLPQRGSVLNVFSSEARETVQRERGATQERSSTLRDGERDRLMPAMVPSSSMRRVSNSNLQGEENYRAIGNSDSLETIHGHGYEPSPTPASRIHNRDSDRIQPLTHRAINNSLNGSGDGVDRADRNNRASIPPPLATLASESLLQRNQTMPSIRGDRERPVSRHKQAAPSTSSTIRPQFPAIITYTNPTTALTLTTHSTVSSSPEAQLFPLTRTGSDSERSARGSGGSNAVTFSRPSTVSVSTALTGLRDRDYRHRTISNNSNTGEPSTSVLPSSNIRANMGDGGERGGPSASAVKAVAKAYGHGYGQMSSPITPLSGSETERPMRKTIGVRGGRASLDGEPPNGSSARGGQDGPGQGAPTLPTSSTKRERRRTVTSLFGQS